MSTARLLPFAAIAALILHDPAAAAQEMGAAVARDDSGDFSCAQRKRVAVRVQADKELLPEAPYQYALGGGLHVLCADYAGPPLQVGRKVRIAIGGDTVRVVQ